MGERERGEREKKEEGKGKKSKRKEGKGEEGLKIGFWNVAGVRGKDEDFWERVKKWDIIGLVETWVEEKEWKQWERRIPKEFK